MVKVLRRLLWFGVLGSTLLLANERLPWTRQAWSAFVIAALVVEVPIWIRALRRLEERGEAQRLEEEEAQRRAGMRAQELAARGAREENERLARSLSSLKSLVEAHAVELAIRREELVKYGRYGIPDYSDWISEKEMFADEVLAANTPESVAALTRVQVLNVIDLVLDGRPPEDALHTSAGIASKSRSTTRPLEARRWTCPACKYQVPADEDTCPRCGASARQPQAVSPSNRHRVGDVSEYPSEESVESNQRRSYIRSTDRLSTISLVSVIPGVFLPGLGAFQVVALVVGIVALRRSHLQYSTRLWQAWVGAGLGLVYTLYFVVRFMQGYWGLA